MDLELVVQPSGQCSLSPPKKVYPATCTYSNDGVTVQMANVQAELKYRNDKLDGYLEGYSNPRAFLTMTK